MAGAGAASQIESIVIHFFQPTAAGFLPAKAVYRPDTPQAIRHNQNVDGPAYRMLGLLGTNPARKRLSELLDPRGDHHRAIARMRVVRKVVALMRLGAGVVCSGSNSVTVPP